MKIALIALILGLAVAADCVAQSVWIRRPGPCRVAAGVAWTTGGISWRFGSAPARIWRPVGWASPRWWGSPVVFAGGPWGTPASRPTWAPAWSPSHAVVPDPVVIPFAALLTEPGVGEKP
jgi:hypothetical protein